MREYPNDCVRCGMCCIAENCAISMATHGVSKVGAICPSLSWDSDGQATCKLCNPQNAMSREVFGVDKGCCVLAHAVREIDENKYEVYEFHALSKTDKYTIVSLVKRGMGKLIQWNEKGGCTK